MSRAVRDEDGNIMLDYGPEIQAISRYEYPDCLDEDGRAELLVAIIRQASALPTVQRPHNELSPEEEAFVQFYVGRAIDKSRGKNAKD